MNYFCYNGVPYLRIIPCKQLFKSTTIHEVVNRGSFFAVNMNTRVFTVLPNGADEGCTQVEVIKETVTPPRRTRKQ